MTPGIMSFLIGRALETGRVNFPVGNIGRAVVYPPELLGEPVRFFDINSKEPIQFNETTERWEPLA